MPSAPLIRFHALAIGDWGSFTIAETFLDISDSGQTRILSRLADQEELHFDVFGSDCKYRYSKHVGHSREVRQQLNRIVARAAEYRSSLSSDKQGFEAARAEYGASLLNLSPGT